MCITFAGADIGDTILFGCSKGNRHTVFYGVGQFASDSKNALAFTVPTDEFNRDNFIDVSGVPSLTRSMQEIYIASNNKNKRSLPVSNELAAGVDVFTVGSWNVVVAKQASVPCILAALETIPFETRPEITDELLAAFISIGDPIVLACVPPTDGGMEDLVYSYVPRDVSTIILPALDGHGSVPKPGKVRRDHSVFASTTNCWADYQIDITELLNKVPALDALIPYWELGSRLVPYQYRNKTLVFDGGDLKGQLKNGDISFDLSSLEVKGSDRNFKFVWPEGL